MMRKQAKEHNRKTNRYYNHLKMPIQKNPKLKILDIKRNQIKSKENLYIIREINNYNHNMKYFKYHKLQQLYYDKDDEAYNKLFNDKYYYQYFDINDKTMNILPNYYMYDHKNNYHKQRNKLYPMRDRVYIPTIEEKQNMELEQNDERLNNREMKQNDQFIQENQHRIINHRLRSQRNQNNQIPYLEPISILSNNSEMQQNQLNDLQPIQPIQSNPNNELNQLNQPNELIQNNNELTNLVNNDTQIHNNNDDEKDTELIELKQNMDIGINTDFYILSKNNFHPLNLNQNI